MKDDLTLVAVLVDHSGSMSTCREDMQGGLNTFIEEQRKLPGLLDLAVAHFDHRFEIVRPMGRLESPFEYSLIPSGNTALRDAMGRFITDIGGQLRDKSEEERPAKVIMVIVTDGKDNASKEWDKGALSRLVQQQQDQWKWEFVFLGANIDAISEARSLGIPTGSSLTFTTNNSLGVYGMASSYVGTLRSTGKRQEFTETDRQNAVKS